jgi:S-adenosylmethionine:tRNA ribosyltransferase-isomerase
VQTADFDFELPSELIAQRPAPEREQSRLLVFQRDSRRIEHARFGDVLQYFQAGDVLVLNDSRVIPARLRGVNVVTGGEFELLLVEQKAVNDWWVMLRPGKRARRGTEIRLQDHRGTLTNVRGFVMEKNSEGHCRLRFSGTPDVMTALDDLGEVPLPPYIRRRDRSELEADRDRYQTVFATSPGSVAAPTAGLHFTQALLEQIRARGVEVCFLTLHVGLGTFAPVKSETLAGHRMHEERFEMTEQTARAIRQAKRERRRIIAVGTTSVRVLETMAESLTSDPTPWPDHPAAGTPLAGKTSIFIYPPYEFKMVDALLTNFHLPRSTLLMLVSAFAAPAETRGRELMRDVYAEAIRQRYRFFSYGDAMLLL